MKATKESSQTVHTITVELTDKEFNQLVIDQRALTPGFNEIQRLVNAIREAIQPKPVTRRTGEPLMGPPGFGLSNLGS